MKIYLDTSVVSYLEQEDAPERMLETRKLWNILMEDKHDVCISDIVIGEIAKCEENKREKIIDF